MYCLRSIIVILIGLTFSQFVGNSHVSTRATATHVSTPKKPPRQNLGRSDVAEEYGEKHPGKGLSDKHVAVRTRASGRFSRKNQPVVRKSTLLEVRQWWWVPLTVAVLVLFARALDARCVQFRRDHGSGRVGRQPRRLAARSKDLDKLCSPPIPMSDMNPLMSDSLEDTEGGSLEGWVSPFVGLHDVDVESDIYDGWLETSEAENRSNAHREDGRRKRRYIVMCLMVTTALVVGFAIGFSVASVLSSPANSTASPSNTPNEETSTLSPSITTKEDAQASTSGPSITKDEGAQTSMLSSSVTTKEDGETSALSPPITTDENDEKLTLSPSNTTNESDGTSASSPSITANEGDGATDSTVEAVHSTASGRSQLLESVEPDQPSQHRLFLTKQQAEELASSAQTRVVERFQRDEMDAYRAEAKQAVNECIKQSTDQYSNYSYFLQVTVTQKDGVKKISKEFSSGTWEQVKDTPPHGTASSNGETDRVRVHVSVMYHSEGQ